MREWVDRARVLSLLGLGLLARSGHACDLWSRVGEAPIAAVQAVVADDVPQPAGGLGEPPLVFTRHDIDPQGFGQVTEGINVGDIDGDGRLDVVEAGDQYLVWYHNPDWTPQVIAEGVRYGAGAMVVVRDIDGDGRLDVLTGRYPAGHPEQRETIWFANTPDGWVEHQLSDSAYCHDLAFGDFDGDGRVDAACDDQFLAQILWLRAPEDPTDPWERHLIDTRRAMGADAADIDGDGRPDVIAGRAWYRLEDDGSWSRHPYTTLTDDADPRFDDFEKVDVLDLDGDGRPDVFATLFADSREGRVYAFLAPPDPASAPWTAVEIDPGPLFGVHSQAPAAFDRTARPQVMVGETNVGGFGFGPNPDPKIYVYRLLGDPRQPGAWERTLVERSGTHEGRAADLDGDGWPDLVGDEENTDLLVPPRDGKTSWWHNATVALTTTTTLPPPPSGGCASGADCDDGDPCTADACNAGGCLHVPAVGYASITCLCGAGGRAACAGEPRAAGVGRPFVEACALVDEAETASAARARHLMHAALRLLAEEGVRAGQAAKHHLLSPACAEAMRTADKLARTRTRGLLTARR